MGGISEFFHNYISSLPRFTVTGLIEVLIIAAIVYGILSLIMSTHAWTLLKGILVILCFTLFAYIFRLTTILWILEKISTIAVVVLVIVFQPELRNALEQLGNQKFLNMIGFNSSAREGETMTRASAMEIATASFSMAAERTGALICIEQRESLARFVQTGISINGQVSKELLINIFQKNTPLHDGAVIIRANTVLAATCYLPLSDNPNISKALGTRHRAALGMSEITDSIVIIVSEETGRVSIAYRGKLQTLPDETGLQKVLINRINIKEPTSWRTRLMTKGKNRDA